jgi:hypothetical protein
MTHLISFFRAILLFSACLASISYIDNVSQAQPLHITKTKDDKVAWEAFDSSSICSKTEITSTHLQGLWKAYEGLFKFGEVENSMKLTSPFIIEIKDTLYRRSPKSDFKRYTLKGNLIISERETKIDSGYINKITANELTISWKNQSNYTRYYYTK